MGGTSYKGKQQLLTPEQQQFLSGSLSGQGPAGQAYQQLLQPQQQDYSELFQQSFIDPALQTFQQQMVPGIQQRFVDAGAGSSSALNQALAKAAQNISTQLGSQMGAFNLEQQKMQQYGQLNALQQMAGLAGQRTFEPKYQQNQGLIPMAIQAAGTAAKMGAF